MTNNGEGVVAGQPRRYISGHYHRPRRTHEEVIIDFWKRVEKGEGSNACWLWTGYRNEDGYGIIRINNKLMRTHRLSFLIAHGYLTPDLEVCHNCPGKDNPSCINPAHLFEGTTKENIQDAERKGTRDHHIGVENGRAIINEEIVREMRRLREIEGLSCAEITKRFDLSYSGVVAVLRYESWKHVT
jgi:hypothetical protein